ncbi:MAG: glycosyltransferase [Paludibacteraceae bacterium]|nr:glycosyltransferase [Paludibacteraceae bacterium]
MKVIFVASGNKFGGKVSSFVQSQFDSLQAAGLEMIMCGVPEHGWKAYAKTIFRLRRLVRKEHPNIVHAHYSTCGFVASLATLGMCHRPRIVVSILGSFPSHSKKWKRVRWAITHLWDQTITKSKRTAEQLGFDLPVIPNGVNTDIFYPMDKMEARQRVEFEANKKYVVWCSNPARPEKNWDLAQRAVELYNAQYTAQCVLIPVYNKTPQEVATYMNAADVMLLTSESEGSPNVIKEALACNCPIVTTDVGDVHERLDGIEGCYIILADGTATYGLQGVGEWFEKDAIALANCLAKALEYGQRTKGYDRIISDKITVKDIAARILNVYSQLLINQ